MGGTVLSISQLRALLVVVPLSGSTQLASRSQQAASAGADSSVQYGSGCGALPQMGGNCHWVQGAAPQSSWAPQLGAVLRNAVLRRNYDGMIRGEEV